MLIYVFRDHVGSDYNVNLDHIDKFDYDLNPWARTGPWRDQQGIKGRITLEPLLLLTPNTKRNVM